MRNEIAHLTERLGSTNICSGVEFGTSPLSEAIAEVERAAESEAICQATHRQRILQHRAAVGHVALILQQQLHDMQEPGAAATGASMDELSDDVRASLLDNLHNYRDVRNVAQVSRGWRSMSQEAKDSRAKQVAPEGKAWKPSLAIRMEEANALPDDEFPEALRAARGFVAPQLVAAHPLHTVRPGARPL